MGRKVVEDTTREQESRYLELRCEGKNPDSAAKAIGAVNYRAVARRLEAKPDIASAIKVGYRRVVASWTAVNEKARGTLDDAMDASDEIAVYCPHCKKAHVVHVKAWPVRVSAAGKVLDTLAKPTMVETLADRASKEDEAITKDELTRKILGSPQTRVIEVIPLLIPAKSEIN